MNNPDVNSAKPGDPDAYSKEAIEFFISQPLKLSDRFMKKIYADDQFYRQARYAFVADAKQLFLYGCARQVKKACISLAQREDFVTEVPKEEDGNETLGREIIESVSDEQNLWIRKLIEILVNLINFKNMNINEAYRIFLSAENLDLFLGKQKDFRDFYGFTSGNVHSSVQDYRERIHNDLKSLGMEKIWFLDGRKLNGDYPSVFASILSRYKSALPVASDDEKLVLGATYHHVFSMASLSAHASIGSLPIRISFQSTRSNVAHISILSQHIMSLANHLMGFEESESIEKLMTLGSNAPDLMKKYKRRFDVADLVLAYGDLAEVLELKESPFGYTSYKIKYLGRPPLPELPEDWLPSEEIVRILKKSTIRQFWEANAQKFSHIKEVNLLLQQSDDTLYEITKRTFIDLESRGVLIPMLYGRRPTKRGK